MKKILRVGTRGSPLALIQAEDVRARLLAAHTFLHGEIDVEIVPIRTSGDWRPSQKERTFLEMGGDKGLFTKEIEEALLAGVIDMAVHSMKDMPTRLPNGLEIAAFIERADPRDALIVREEFKTIADLPKGAEIGTSSVRRQAQILAYRPDLHVTPLRGNVGTRLEKLAKGDADATVLALAGMQRLGIGDRVSSIIDPEIMLPSAGQGAIGIEIRTNDKNIRELLAPVHCAATAACVGAERAFLFVLDGSCTTPVAALGRLEKNDRLVLDVLVAKPDGSNIIRMSRSGAIKEALAIGEALGHEIKNKLPADFFTSAA